MNRNSPVPLWAVLSVGVVLVGGIYVAAQRAAVQPQASVIVRQPAVSTPSVSAVANPSIVSTPIASATPSTTLVPPIPASSPTSSPVGTAEPVPSDWAMYENTKYGYEIRYPRTWHVSTPGDGEAGESDGTEADIIISAAVGDPGINIVISVFGTSDMGIGQFKNAENLDEFINGYLLTAATTTQARPIFQKKSTISRQPAVWFTACLDPSDNHAGCVSRVYLQAGSYLYDITGNRNIDQLTTNAIINSLQFTRTPN